MAISRVREDEIVNSRIGKQEQQEERCSVFAFANCANEAPKSQDGGGEKHGILEWREGRNLRRARQAAPVVDEALDAEPGESGIAGADEIHGLAFSGSDILEFA